jgi:hypothetical protein
MPILSKGTTFATGDQVTAAKLNNLVDNATFGANIVDGSTLTTSGSGTSATILIRDLGVSTAKIAANAVTTDKIADANVTTVKILDANVTTAKIADSNVTTAKIADSNVTTAKIADLNVTTGKIADSAVTTAKLAQPLTRGTAVNVSGTSVDFTSIPSWVKRITVVLSGVSTNGSSMILFRLGTGGTPATSGYTGAASTVGENDNSSSSSSSTAGVPISGYSIAAGSTFWGNVIFTNVSGNAWSCSGVVTGGSTATMLAGSITLGGVLNILRITTAGGTAAFDAGTVNIMYE